MTGMKSFLLRLAALLMGFAVTANAHIGVQYQMQLGNPTDAKPDDRDHQHYLIQRTVFAEDYDDQNGEPNWVSWDLTAEDIGPAKRTPTFHADSELPASFHHIKSADYKQSGFDRGHMCPSADRSDDATDNAEVFAMSNIIPQSKDNNEGVWEKLERDCRTWAEQGNELLIICGPAGFNGTHLNGYDPVMVPSHTWKIIVEVPNGQGPVLSRISTSTRVIAVDIPNTDGVRDDPWTKYLVSVNQLETLTGYHFFTALSPDVSAVLKAKIDGQPTPAISFAKAIAASPQRPTPQQMPSGITIALAIVFILLVLCAWLLIVFLRSTAKK